MPTNIPLRVVKKLGLCKAEWLLVDCAIYIVVDCCNLNYGLCDCGEKLGTEFKFLDHVKNIPIS